MRCSDFTRVARAASLFLLCTFAVVRTDAAGPAAGELPWPDGTPQQIREDIFGLRFRMKRELDGAKAGLTFLQREFERDPRPEVKAYLGWICLFSKGWGYPERHDEARGLKLVSEAMNEGSVVARDVLARAKGNNIGGPADPAEVTRLMREAAQGGATRSMARLGYYYAVGYGVQANLSEAERWARRAAELGQPMGLFEIGQAYERGVFGGKPDLALAMHYYYRASYHSDTDGRQRLAELAKQGIPDAALYQAIAMVHVANASAWIPPTRVKEQVRVLEQQAGNNAQALYELGVAHLDGVYASRDYAVARDCLHRAALQGHTAARFYLMKMRLRGWGEPAQPDAVKEMEAMADLGIPEAANYVGFINYWGTDEAGTKRNDEKAFKYVRLAAEKGEPIALMNLGYCYEHGIGTPENYALAAKVYWQAYLRGYTQARDRVKSLLPFVK
jgi:TPR repeat protein